MGEGAGARVVLGGAAAEGEVEPAAAVGAEGGDPAGHGQQIRREAGRSGDAIEQAGGARRAPVFGAAEGAVGCAPNPTSGTSASTAASATKPTHGTSVERAFICRGELAETPHLVMSMRC